MIKGIRDFSKKENFSAIYTPLLFFLLRLKDTYKSKAEYRKESTESIVFSSEKNANTQFSG